MRIAFLGLGNMGTPMAIHLLSKGHELTVFNRTTAKTRPLIEAGAKLARTAAEAVENCEVAISMLANDQAVHEILLMPAPEEPHVAIEALPVGSVHMSCSTISVDLAKQLA